MTRALAMGIAAAVLISVPRGAFASQLSDLLRQAESQIKQEASRHTDSGSGQRSSSGDVDRKVQRIQQALDLASVSRDTLRAVLLQEKVEGIDYLTIAGDVVTAADTGKKVRDKKWSEAMKSAGKWGSKKALTYLGLGGIATIWTATELGIAGGKYLVGKINDSATDWIIHDYIVRRQKGDSDEDAWDIVSNTGLWPVPEVPFGTPENQMADELQRRRADLKNRVHDQCKCAWTIVQALPQAERDKQQLRAKLLSLAQGKSREDPVSGISEQQALSVAKAVLADHRKPGWHTPDDAFVLAEVGRWRIVLPIRSGEPKVELQDHAAWGTGIFRGWAMVDTNGLDRRGRETAQGGASLYKLVTVAGRSGWRFQAADEGNGIPKTTIRKLKVPQDVIRRLGIQVGPVS